MDSEKSARCDQLYAAVLSLDSSDNYVLFKLADCFLKGYDLDKLRAMITSSNTCHIRDALFILGEIGSMTELFKDDLLRIADGDDGELSAGARKLAEIY